jgi:hypothetical protein
MPSKNRAMHDRSEAMRRSRAPAALHCWAPTVGASPTDADRWTDAGWLCLTLVSLPCRYTRIWRRRAERAVIETVRPHLPRQKVRGRTSAFAWWHMLLHVPGCTFVHDLNCAACRAHQLTLFSCRPHAPQYLHESRHRHAVNRQRGNKGRFTNHHASDKAAQTNTGGSSGTDDENDFVDLDFLCSITGPLSPTKQLGLPAAIGVRAASAVCPVQTADEEVGSLLGCGESAASARVWPGLSPQRTPLSPLLGSRLCVAA